MHSSTYIALFAGSVAAQSSVNLFQIFSFEGDTLTQIGSDATATTYKNECTAGGISVVPSGLRPTPDSPSATITPAPTPRARLARQASATASASDDGDDDDDDDDDDYSFCEPYTLKQGASTWEFSFTDPSPGAWAASMNCKWQGAITNADLTCTVSQTGYAAPASLRGSSSTVIPKNEIKSAELIHPVAVVSASQTASGKASGTPSGSPARSGSGAGSASGSPGAAQSTALAPGGPAPTGSLAFVGGAAGILAAALAL